MNNLNPRQWLEGTWLAQREEDRVHHIELYRRMYLVRKTEELIQAHYAEDEMKTPMHMSMGEEAIVVGVCHALDAGDQVLGTYRSHALYLAKTMETERFFGEMYGRVTGPSKGKGGSMHLFAPDQGVICTSAIVGSHLPVAVGAAFANKRSGNDKVIAVFFGDGAIDEGAFWESLNVACLMHLPVVFVCEDNGFAVHTPASMRHGYRSITDIVGRFDCNSFQSDSTDVQVIYDLTREALATMKRNHQPCFLNLEYWRYLEHVGVREDYEAEYRAREDFERWWERDPVHLQRKRLLTLWSEEEVSAVEQALTFQIEADLRCARGALFPGEQVLVEDVFA